MTDDAYIDFQCNCCGSHQHTPVAKVAREDASCFGCGSSVRMRSIVHHIGMALFQRPLILPDFPRAKGVRGLGMSDWDGYATGFAKVFSYTNTFLHQDPRLDISRPLPDLHRGDSNFVVCSEVLEHIAPPVQTAVDNLAAMLKPGGFLVLTIPYAQGQPTREHFPDFTAGKLVEVEGTWGFVYRTRDGGLRLGTDLVFHGGPGDVLEMRQFGLADVVAMLERAGFCEIRVQAGEYRPFGIVNQHHDGLPITAWKPLEQ